METNLKINNINYSVNVEPDKSLLWVIREYLNLTGTKYGCGVGQCGACTVLVDGVAKRSCSTPVSTVLNSEITTIENSTDPIVKKVQMAWVAEDVVQCGYCQPGQIMNATGLLKSNPKPSDEEIVTAMNGNICRCGTYNRIKAAIKKIDVKA